MAIPGSAEAVRPTGPGLAFPTEVIVKVAFTISPGVTVTTGGSTVRAIVGIAGTT